MKLSGKKALHKSTRRDIRGSFGRFFAIFAIIALGVGFFSGVRITTPTMVHTIDEFYKEKNFFDYKLVSTLGWEEQDVEELRKQDIVLAAEGSITYDVICLSKENTDEVYKAHLLTENVNRLLLREGRLPETGTEVLVDSKHRYGWELGDTLTFASSNSEESLEHFARDSYTIVGFADSSLYINFERGTTSLGNGLVSGFLYFTKDAFKGDIYTELYVDMDVPGEIYSDEYDDRMDQLRSTWEELTDHVAGDRYKRVKSEAEQKLEEARSELAEEKEKNQKKLDDAKKELDDAAKKIADSEKEIPDGEKELADAKETLDQTKQDLADAESVLKDSEKEIYNGRAELEKNKRLLDDAKAELDQKEPVLTAAKEELDQNKSVLDATKEKLDKTEAILTETKEKLDQAKLKLDATKKELDQKKPFLPVPVYEASLNEYNKSLSEYEAAEAKYTIGYAEYTAGCTAYAEGLKAWEQGKAQYDTGFAEYSAGLAAWKTGYAQYTAAEKQFKDGLARYQKGYAEYLSGREQYEEGLKKYEDGVRDLEEGKQKLADGRKEYADGLKEYEDGKKEFEEKIAEAEEKIADGEEEIADLKEPETFLMERNTNIGYACFENDSDIVAQVAQVFPVFFILVAALVCMTTMTRMVEEQRGQIGVLKALGYSNADIMMKYTSYSGLASLTGCIFGYAVGIFLFPGVIWITYKLMYISLEMRFTVNWTLALISILVSTLCSVGVTYISCRYELSAAAAELMRPKAPKPGKRVFLERIPAIWNRMKFLHKVSVRNIFRYKGRFFMMIVGISGSMALLLTGFGMKDSIADFSRLQYEEIQVADLEVNLRNGRSEEVSRELLDKLGERDGKYILTYAGSWDIVKDKVVKSVNLIVPESQKDFREFFRTSTMSGKELPMPKQGEILICSSLAERQGLAEGDEVCLRSDDLEEVRVRIAGVFRNHIYNYVIASPEDIRRGVNTAYVICAEGTDVYQAQASIAKCKDVSYVNVFQDTKERMADMMSRLDVIVLIVVLSAAGLAFVVLYNLTNINITERLREIATIKVLGFYPGETAQYVFRENVLLTFFGMLAGLGLGILLHAFVMKQIVVDMVFFNRQIKPMSFLYSIVLIFVFTFLVNLFMRGKLEKINMAESLKSVE